MLYRVLLFALVSAACLGAQTKKIVVLGGSEEMVAELRAEAPSNAQLVHLTNPRSMPAAELEREIADAHAFLGNPTVEMVTTAKDLEWVQITSAGVKPFLYPELVNSDVVMTNARIMSSDGIADHGFAMLLALTRKLNVFMPNREIELWDRRNHGLQQLRGKTALIIGTGGIGSAVAQRAKAFGMTTIGVDPVEFPPRPAFDRMVYPDRLDQVTPLANVVFICAPRTKDSEGMFGSRQFELLQRGSYFIALSRGQLYDMDALVKALDSQAIAGAGVDVTVPEPLPKGHALWGFSNAIITPHIATQGEGHMANRMILYKENIARFAAGEQLTNIVDMHDEY